MKHLRMSFGASLVVSAIAGAACTGGGSSTGTNGPTRTSSGGSTKATPQGIFEGRLQLGTGNDCPDVGPLFGVGRYGDSSVEPSAPSQPIKDGEDFGGGPVTVACSVTPTGGGAFAVSGTVELAGPQGGSFHLTGDLAPTGEQSGVYARFASPARNVYEESTCVVRYETPSQGVAQGRVWGEITCAKAADSATQKSCEAIAQFRFENCTQE